MNPYEIAKYFLEFAKELVGLGSTLQKAKLEKRTRLAEHLDNIAGCLEAIGIAFNKKEEPHEQCGALEEYARSLPNVCKGILSEADIERFKELLERKAHGRAVLFILHDETSRKAEIDLMARAAGELKALAGSLKV